jgi:uncharacterized protein (DUF952 family)
MQRKPWTSATRRGQEAANFGTVDAETTGRAPVPTIYKICDHALWQEAERAGAFHGAPVDARDGFIHFSTASQAGETAARHFASAAGLMLVAVDSAALGSALRWEPSRGGAMFPHLYGPLPLEVVRWVKPLPLGADGRHLFPELEP